MMPHELEETPYFQIDGLTVGYDGCALIREISVTLRRGEILTLIGPNGAGKSTILKTIARHIKPIAGSMRLGGRPIVELSSREFARELSVVLTDRLRTEMLTCQDIVETGRYPYTGRMGLLSEKDRAIVERYLKLTSTWEIRDKDFMQTSDGKSSASCSHARYARNRTSSCWMSSLRFWMCATRWSFWGSCAPWRKRTASRL